MHLGELIKEYRTHQKLSMQAFADKCDVSKGYIAMLERNVNSKTGEPVVPSIETFIKVSQAMNMPLSELIEKVDENQPINLAAIMGLDVPMEVVPEPTIPSDLTPDEAELLSNYQKLNTTGQTKAQEYVSDLAEQEKYTQVESSLSASA